MKATDFEYRHQLLLHELIVGAALLTYLVDREDVVWRYIKSCDHAILLEHWLFAITTLLFGISACLCTIPRAYPSTEDTSGSTQGLNRVFPGSFYQLRLVGDFLYALALASLLPLSGLFITMIVFTLTLKDRIAEVLIGASVVLWILLTLRLSEVRSCLRVCLADRHA